MSTTTRIIAAIALLLSLFTEAALAQMAAFEQSMQGMRNKLPASVFDGVTLNVTDHEQLQQVKGFGQRYAKNLQAAIDAWSQLGRGQNQERLDKLKADKAYYDALVVAYKDASQRIQQPATATPPASRAATPIDQMYIGPDAGSAQPFVVDTIGGYQTEITVYGQPGTKAKPSRWGAKLKFYLKYAELESDDTIMIDVRKDGASLGDPTPCQPKARVAETQLAYFECEAPGGRDYERFFSSDGPHTVALTYRNLIMGTEFKDFAVFQVDVIAQMQGAANDPDLRWAASHDMKLSVSTIDEELPHSNPNDGGITLASRFAKRIDESRTVLRTWIKRDKGHHPTKITCIYNGKRIDNAEGFKDREHTAWSYAEKGSMERIQQQWIQLRFEMNGMLARANADGTKNSYSQPPHYLNENPGDYRCVLTGGGEIIKELFFSVGVDGEIVKPACQLGSMNSLVIVTLLESKDHKLSTVPYDEQAGRQSGFEGRVQWTAGCPPTR